MNETKMAKALLRLRYPKDRQRWILIYSAGLLGLFLLHTYSHNLTSPLKLIPEMFTAMAMGWVLLAILSLRQFTHTVVFIDWNKVIEAADPVFPDSNCDAENR